MWSRIFHILDTRRETISIQIPPFSPLSIHGSSVRSTDANVSCKTARNTNGRWASSSPDAIRSYRLALSGVPKRVRSCEEACSNFCSNIPLSTPYPWHNISSADDILAETSSHYRRFDNLPRITSTKPSGPARAPKHCSTVAKRHS